MIKQLSLIGPACLLVTFVVGPGFSLPKANSDTSTVAAQVSGEEIRCTLDLTNPGKMSDIISNALNRGLDADGIKVRAYLDKAAPTYSTGKELLKAAAIEFGHSEAVLAAQVEKYRHCNCAHQPLVKGQITAADDHWAPPAGPAEVSQFAQDVTLHVVLHEMGHALIREFDLPVLGNEETIADAFATHYLTTYLPDRALDVLRARTTSLMIEAGQVPREGWSVNGEHNNDARRAFQIAALAVAADPKKYSAMATEVGLTDRDIKKASDYGTEVHRSWRRILRPLWMPEGVASSEARVKYDSDVEFLRSLCEDGLEEEVSTAIKRFDWHSQVTVNFAHSGGSAGWSRSKRTITVNSEYVYRFMRQGESDVE